MTEFISNLIICSGNETAVLFILTMAKKREKHRVHLHYCSLFLDKLEDGLQQVSHAYLLKQTNLLAHLGWSE
ncbi:hypothetical protein LEMLEM_LOCUS23127, partial [Lemmus lemmus]